MVFMKIFQNREKLGWKDLISTIPLIVSIFLLIATLWLAYSTSISAKATLDLVQEQKRLNRPAVDIKFKEYDGIEELSDGSIRMKYKISIKNSGNTIAKDIAIKAAVFLPEKILQIDDKIKISSATIRKNVGTGLFAAVPNQEIETELDVIFVSSQKDALLLYLDNEEFLDLLFLRIVYYPDNKSFEFSNCSFYHLGRSRDPVLISNFLDDDCKKELNRMEEIYSEHFYFLEILPN